MTKNAIISIVFSAVLLIGILVCLICNFAISGNLTWALIPVSSIVFAWVISFPSLILGKRGLVPSLIALSVFTIPYLFLLSGLINVKEVFSIGVVMAVPSIVFLWIIVATFKCVGKSRRLTALGIAFLLAIPFLLIIHGLLSKMIEEPALDLWDLLSILVLLLLAVVSFVCVHVKKRSVTK